MRFQLRSSAFPRGQGEVVRGGGGALSGEDALRRGNTRNFTYLLV